MLESMEPHIADSYEYAYLQQRSIGWDELERKLESSEKAYARCESCGEIIENLAYIYEISNQGERAAGLWAKLYQTQRIAPGLFDYTYNMLQSTPKRVSTTASISQAWLRVMHPRASTIWPAL
ncbi:MAG TPA: hypothetical protein EYG11_18870 [Candidatus Latescibacteria bacterium]|nr:hypothetical protein [Candidatus Handelsmanbacteria bacterium]HIL10765.1 hypothetical protein [Candidatus Latescibacterota bacterium]